MIFFKVRRQMKLFTVKPMELGTGQRGYVRLSTEYSELRMRKCISDTETLVDSLLAEAFAAAGAESKEDMQHRLIRVIAVAKVMLNKK